jgi:hypothetical protein
MKSCARAGSASVAKDATTKTSLRISFIPVPPWHSSEQPRR